MLSSILKKEDCASCRFCCSFRRQSLWETPLFDEDIVCRLKELFPDAVFKLIAEESSGCVRDVSSATQTFSGTPQNFLSAQNTSGSQKKFYTFDISHAYKTADPEEEAPCPFLDTTKGCILPLGLKPFDCKIWPFRAVRKSDGTLKVALTPTCPAINKVPREKILTLVQSGLGQQILDYATMHPAIVKAQTEFLADEVW